MQKIFAKPLDKQLYMVYNVITKGEQMFVKRKEKENENFIIERTLHKSMGGNIKHIAIGRKSFAKMQENEIAQNRISKLRTQADELLALILEEEKKENA